MATFAHSCTTNKVGIEAISTLNATHSLALFVLLNNHNILYTFSGSDHPVIDMNGCGTDASTYNLAQANGWGSNFSTTAEICQFFANASYSE